MNVIFVDDIEFENLKPLTLTKPLAELRIGILTFSRRWKKLLNGTFSYETQSYLSKKFPLQKEKMNIYLNPSFFPSKDLIEAIQNLKENELLISKEGKIAYCGEENYLKNSKSNNAKEKEYKKELIHINHPWDLFTHNAHAIEYDFKLLTEGRKSQEISSTNGVINHENIFLEEGATAEYAILNAKEGPIYMGKDSEIMEGSVVRGGLALCEHAKLNLGTKIYSGTTIGPWCKVGGEINNSILMAYSNKGHEGFLGNSVLGEWCNLGADTNNSNLKNNYSEVRAWNYPQKKYIPTGLQFCGLIMGDFSKSAINSQFNTGTVVGVSANVFDSGFPPKFIPSFSWGGNEGSPKFDLEKSYEAAQKMMERRKVELKTEDKEILKYIYNTKEN